MTHSRTFPVPAPPLAVFLTRRVIALQSEVMLQHDGSDEMACTCFMFLKPTPRSHRLLGLWRDNIIGRNSEKNQVRSDLVSNLVSSALVVAGWLAVALLS